MKLIAIFPLRNVMSLRLRDKELKSTVPDAVHDDHVHKGAIFEIGNAPTRKDLANTDNAAAVQVASLIAAGMAGPADDVKIVSAVRADIAADEKRSAREKKLNEQSNFSAIGQKLLEQLATLKPAK